MISLSDASTAERMSKKDIANMLKIKQHAPHDFNMIMDELLLVMLM